MLNEGWWQEKATSQVRRSNVASCVCNGEIYVAGGFGLGESSALEAYNPLTDKWRMLAPMPTARYDLVTESNGGFVYAIGGQQFTTGLTLNTHEAYDPTTNTWSTRPPMPTVRQDHKAECVNNKIYCIGGQGPASQYMTTNEVYDIITNTWVTLAPMPTGRNGHGVSTVYRGTKIYCIGGQDASGYSNKNECYDTVTNTWTTLAPMPTPRRHLGVSYIDQFIYAIAGYNASGEVSVVERYDPATNTWVTVPSLPAPLRDRFATTNIGGKIYVMAGWSDHNVPELLNGNTMYARY